MGRVLVTGASGFIGKRTVQHLVSKGYDVIGLDIVQDSRSTKLIDITDPNCVDLISQLKVESVVHLAAQAEVGLSFKNPVADLQANAVGTLNILTATINQGLTNFVYINSGGAIYSAGLNFPILETATELPISPYGISKLMAEKYVELLCSRSNISWTSLALSNCYGSILENKRGVIYNFWKDLKLNRTPTINGKKTTRDFIHISDVVNAIELSLKRPSNLRLNISSGEETSLLELFYLISEKMRLKVEPNIVELPQGEIPRSVLSNSLAKVTLGWFPKVKLDEGLEISLSENEC